LIWSVYGEHLEYDIMSDEVGMSMGSVGLVCTRVHGLMNELVEGCMVQGIC